MSPSDRAPRARPVGLEDAYEILAELRHTDVTTSWLARERGAPNQGDLVITVVEARALPRRELLAELAADQQLLGARRAPGVIPVIAHRLLEDGSLAIVRPRIRGASLRQLLQATGALSLERTVGVLREISERLDWARRLGVVHRELATDSICFQQGDGRLLVAFGTPQALEDLDAAEPRTPAREPMLARCSDTTTLGRLAWEMLTTRPAPAHDDVGAMSTRRGFREPGLADLRPDLPLSVAADVESALRCEHDATPRGPTAFVASLAATAGLGADEPAPTVAAMSEPPFADEPRRRRGAGALAVTMLAVLVLVAGAILLNRRDDARSRTAHRTGIDTGRVSAGDVAVDRSRVDTTVLRSGERATPEVVPSLPAVAPPAGATARAGAESAIAPRPIGPDPCESPRGDDQQRCLSLRIAEIDEVLDEHYQELIREIGADTAQLRRLRAEQREWLKHRDTDCRGQVTQRGVWAPDFAQCVKEHSAARVRAFRDELDRRRSGR